MALTHSERKQRLPRGAQHKIARRRKGVSESYVSAANAGEVRPKTKGSKEKLRMVQSDLARAMGLPLEDAFSAEELALSEVPGGVTTAAAL